MYSPILSTLEIIVTIVAVIHFLSAGEPTLALPDIALILIFLNKRHPPVDADENRQTDHPFDRDQDQVDPSEDQEPKETVFTLDVGKLNVSAAALGTSLIVCHNYFLLLFSSFVFLRLSFPYDSKGCWFLFWFYF